MAFSRFYLTAAGQEYLAKAQTGSTLRFTMAKIGSGYLPTGAVITDITALITPLQDLGLSGFIASGSSATVKVQFTNRTPTGDLLSPFWWAEAGLFAEIVGDDDYPSALFAYANALDEAHADYIPATLTEFVFNWVCYISNATSITAEIDSGAIFLTTVDDLKDNIVTFPDIEVTEEPLSGETQSTLWSKVKRLFSVLDTAAFEPTSHFLADTNSLDIEAAIADADFIPFYNVTSSSNKKSSWANIKSRLKTYFDTLYSLTTHTHTASAIGLGNVNNIYIWRTAVMLSLPSTSIGGSRAITIPVPEGVFSVRPSVAHCSCDSFEGMIVSYVYYTSSATALEFVLVNTVRFADANGYRFGVIAIQ